MRNQYIYTRKHYIFKNVPHCKNSIIIDRNVQMKYLISIINRLVVSLSWLITAVISFKDHIYI